MLADAHHDVWRQVATHSTVELLIMTSRGTTFRRLFLIGTTIICWICDVNTLSNSACSTNKQVHSTCVLTSSFTPRFILGNINIDLTSVNRTSSELKNMLKSNAISSIITEPTRCNWKTQTTIDHIYTNVSTNPINPFAIQEDTSDHFPVAAELIAAKSKKPRSEAKKKRLILNTDGEELYTKATALFGNLPTLTLENFNVKFDNFISKVLFLLENYSEVKCNTRHQRKLKKRPYTSKGILKSIRTKNKPHHTLIKAGKARKHVRYIDQLKKHCKRYGYILRQVLRRAEDIYYKSLTQKWLNSWIPKKTSQLLVSFECCAGHTKHLRGPNVACWPRARHPWLR